jgi:hypothetical protein
MRLRTFVLSVVFLAAFGWVAYTVALVAWNYYETQALIDKVLWEESGKYKTARATGTADALDKLTRSVRSSVLLAARREGFPVSENDVDVSINSAGIGVAARWSYPVLSYRDNAILVVPISVQRSLVASP